MKTIPIILITGFSICAVAQEKSRPHIPSKIPDGTPAAPAPMKPAWVIPAEDIVAEKAHREGGRTVTVRQIQPIDLPNPPEPSAPVEISAEMRERIAAYQDNHPRHHVITLGATIYRLEDNTTRTLVQIWGNGQPEPATFWSSGDFSLLSGIGAFTDNQGGTRALFMMWSIHDTDQIAKRMAQIGRGYEMPAIPNLPANQAAYVLQEGKLDDDMRVAIDSLHEILNLDDAELRRAYEGRQRATKEREEFLKTNQPQPQDITLNYWHIEKSNPEEKGMAR
jgi:hypothetical protein